MCVPLYLQILLHAFSCISDSGRFLCFLMLQLPHYYFPGGLIPSELLVCLFRGKILSFLTAVTGKGMESERLA